jgi:hypothetical protein
MIFHSYVSLPEGISRYSYFIFVYFQNPPEMSRYFVYFQASVFTHFHIFEHISRYIETFPNISGDFPSPRSTKSNPNSLVVFWCSTEVWWHLSTRPLQWRNAGTPGRNMRNSPPVPSGSTVEDLLTAGWVAFHDGHHGMWSYGSWWNRTLIFQETHSVMSGCSVCVHVWDQELPWTDKMPVPVAQAPKDELLIFPNMFKGLQGVV